MVGRVFNDNEDESTFNYMDLWEIAKHRTQLDPEAAAAAKDRKKAAVTAAGGDGEGGSSVLPQPVQDFIACMKATEENF